MMTLQEIADSASALGNQIRAGIPVAEAAGRLPLLQPNYAEFWVGVTKTIESGRPLSTSLPLVWPDSLVSAVVAGEESGKIEDVFKRIQETIVIQLALRNMVMKLAYPLVIFLVGVIVFIAIMLFVVPKTTSAFSSMRVKSDSAFTSLSAWMVDMFDNYWMGISIGLAVGVAALIKWMKTEEGQLDILNFMLTLPVIGIALRDMYFGLWANYMALMASAGIPTAQSLLITSKVLPDALRAGVLAFERDLSINNRPMDESANPNKQVEGDPRKQWPFYISTAFIVAERTGEIDRELLRVAPSLIEDAMKKMGHAISTANVAALMISGSLIATSFAAIYLPLFSAISHAT